MRKTRREFSPEFKREAVALLESSGRPQMQIAAELGIQSSMLRNWRAIQNGVSLRGRAGQASVPSYSGVEAFGRPGAVHIPTGEGWLYLAAVLDVATRKIVGWAMGDHMRTELALSALMMAVQRQRPSRGLIHHSDRFRPPNTPPRPTSISLPQSVPCRP